VGDEIELVAKSVGESVGALAEVSGVLGPARELADWVTSFIHYRRQPALARQVMKAAEKIRSSGLPAATVSDKLLRDLLEGGSMEDDAGMQDRWANLLANALTDTSANVRLALPKILAEIEPIEALLLDRLADDVGDDSFNTVTFTAPLPVTVASASLDNLVRLSVLREIPERGESKFQLGTTPPQIVGHSFTALGWEFVCACRPS
jgi:hypothetical protein